MYIILQHFYYCASSIAIVSRFVYSVLKLLTGLAIAAFIAWKLTVITAISKASNPAVANTHQEIFILYAKPSSHLLIAHHAIGVAITIATHTSFIKSLDNNCTMLPIDAPKTFLTPISLVRCCAV
ncbi:MAG: hypothetical protein WKF91_17405 [Segetibacter sp.]